VIINDLIMVLDKLSSIKTFIFDIDGVFTKGQVLAQKNGDQSRFFNIKDGFAVQYAIKQKYNVIIISGGNSEGVKQRLRTLGITAIHMGVSDKKEFLAQLSNQLNLNLNEALYMGDDYPDLSPMRMCGLKVAPADAAWEVLKESNMITKAKGGEGAIREIIVQVLTIQDAWQDSNHAVW